MNALRMLLIDELRDLLDAEKQLTRALPKMERAASAAVLKTAFGEHLKQTRVHVSRLEQALTLMKAPVRGKPCPGMKGLISEGQEMMGELIDPPVRDAALIVSAQKVEHYEIAAYGSCKAFAGLLGESKVVTLLDETLAEEKKADATLSRLAEGEVNPSAEAAIVDTTKDVTSGIFAQAAEWMRDAVKTVGTVVEKRVTRPATRSGRKQATTGDGARAAGRASRRSAPAGAGRAGRKQARATRKK